MPSRPLVSAAVIGASRSGTLLRSLAAAAFLAGTLGCRRDEPIRATPEILAALEEDRTELLGRALTQEERATLREEWIDQEILVREAYRLGLDKNDGVVRHRLLEKMRVLLAMKPKAPSRDELRAYYDAHRERYRSPELISFDHVMFAKVAESTSREAGAPLLALKRGADFRKMGQPFWLGPTLAGLSEAELGRVLGDAFARDVSRLPLGEWSGPLPSIRGVHYVRLTEKRPPVVRAFEEVEGRVREDFLEGVERAALKKEIAGIAGRYEVDKTR